MILACFAGTGIFFILLGLIIATDRYDKYVKPTPRQLVVIETPRRPHTKTPTPVVSHKPFIHSDTQCRGCGLDGELLTIDTQKCWVCHERTAN